MISISVLRVFLFCLILNAITTSTKGICSEILTGTTIHIVFSDSADVIKKLQEENTRKILSDLFPDYLKIKNYLSQNDSSSAQKSALQLLDKVESNSDSIKKNVPRNWELFMKYAPQAKARISATNSLTEQRFFFGILSNYIIEFVNLYGMKNKTVYVLQCKDKAILGSGKWLTDFIDGKNPFLGPGNENCIEVVETKMH